MTASFGSAFILDGAGGIRSTSSIGGSDGASDEPTLILLDAGDPRTARWVAESTALDDDERAAFLGPMQRTWASVLDAHDEPTLMLLLEPPEQQHRNPQTGSEPPADRDDGAPASARLLLSARRLVAVLDLNTPTPMLDRARRALEERRGARSPIALFIALARAWTGRYLTDLLALERATVALEEQVPDPERRGALDSLHELRLQATLLRRRFGSLRMAVHSVDNVAGFPPLLAARDAWNGVVRETDELVELLDGIIGRIQVIDHHFRNQLSAALSDRLYVLTLISAVLMPMSFITGLLGVNIGGIPLRDSRWGFWLLCFLLVLIAGGQYVLAKRLRWLPRQGSFLSRRPRWR
jgi:zinc transporter